MGLPNFFTASPVSIDGRNAARASYTISPGLCGWAAVGAFACLPILIAQVSLATLLIGLAGLAHSSITFWRDGGQRITAPGIYMIGSGLFAFFPAIYLFFDDPIAHGRSSFLGAVIVAYLSQLLLYYLFWQQRPAKDRKPVSIGNRSVTTWGMCCGISLIAVGLVLGETSIAAVGLHDGAAFAGIVLLAVSSLRRARRVGLFGYLVVVAGFLIYLELVFTGFGRLQVGALGLAIALVAACRWNGRTVKLTLLLAFPFVVAALGAWRVAFTSTLNPYQESSDNGLGSVIGPFIRFGELLYLDIDNEIAYTWGQSFLAAATALIPRAIWPDKPIGFGAELGLLFRPELVGSGHSELALLLGEWLFAFGLLGLLLMVPVIGWSVRMIDTIIASVDASRIDSRGMLLVLTALVILTTSIADLYWGGSFTYVARVGPRLLALLPLFMVFGWDARPSWWRTRVFRESHECDSLKWPRFSR